MKTAKQIVEEFNSGISTDSVSKRELIDHLSDQLSIVQKHEDNEHLRYRDRFMSGANETLGRYVSERDREINRLNNELRIQKYPTAWAYEQSCRALRDVYQDIANLAVSTLLEYAESDAGESARSTLRNIKEIKRLSSMHSIGEDNSNDIHPDNDKC